MGGAEEEDPFAVCCKTGRFRRVIVGKMRPPGGGEGGGGEVDTILIDRGICRRMRPRDRSKSIRRAWEEFVSVIMVGVEREKVAGTDGAMIIRAPGWGIGLMSSMEVGTASSQLWSCLERVGPLSVYQEPAWLASRVVIVRGCLSVRMSWVWHRDVCE